MVLYGPRPTAADLAYNELARQKIPPPFDGTDPEPFWNCTRNNVTFRVRAGSWDQYGQWFTFIHSGESEMIEYAIHNLAPAGTSVVDVGSAYGSYTIPFLVNGHPVYSFELEVESFHEMMSHIRFNNSLIKDEHVNCYNYGLWSSETHGDYYNLNYVKFRRLDDVLPDISDVSFVKIDVEGAELEVMKGGGELLINNQPNMWIECHEIFKPGITPKVLDMIHELGFKGMTIREFEMVPGTKHLLISR